MMSLFTFVNVGAASGATVQALEVGEGVGVGEGEGAVVVSFTSAQE
jgi:hypothetical protein